MFHDITRKEHPINKKNLSMRLKLQCLIGMVEYL